MCVCLGVGDGGEGVESHCFLPGARVEAIKGFLKEEIRKIFVETSGLRTHSLTSNEK